MVRKLYFNVKIIGGEEDRLENSTHPKEEFFFYSTYVNPLAQYQVEGESQSISVSPSNPEKLQSIHLARRYREYRTGNKDLTYPAIPWQNGRPGKSLEFTNYNQICLFCLLSFMACPAQAGHSKSEIGERCSGCLLSIPSPSFAVQKGGRAGLLT